MSQICDTLTLKKCLKSNRLLEIQIINITLAQYTARFRRSNQTTKTNERKRNTKKMREKDKWKDEKGNEHLFDLW